jgi:phosphoglycolate phosphatase
VSDPRRLILWDVDGTLLSAGSAARTAFSAAVTAVVGRELGVHDISMSGKTDPQIALEILAALAMTEDEARRHLPGVLATLERELEAAVDVIRRDGRVHPGVAELLPRLAATPGVIQSLLTGNLEANARMKVAAFGLDRWLDFEAGAYGSDDADRERLVPVALARAARRFGSPIEPSQVWVVGDTPRDLACARAGGARCLLVGTGRDGYEPLRGLDADAVLPDLSDVEAVLDLLTAGTGAARSAAQPST